ncbi:MAG TPA: AAA family ATPase, partial [Rhodocyclaceae bacterium]|nr:AAA family ATPase [Rhodocyclaceae bacterium]
MARKKQTSLPLTKLRPPHSEGRQLERPRLLERLVRIRDHRLALVVAPTGSGKTTVLADAFDLLQRSGAAAAWLTLDAGDRSPHRFLCHLVVAAQHAMPQAGHEALAMLDSSNVAAEAVLGALINDLTLAETPLVLFLDDFQEVDSPEIASLIIYLLRYLPSNVHLVLASQRDFPLPLSWIRARSAVIDIGWNDLQMNLDEVRSYLVDTRALTITEDQVADLATQTEGWVCALQLASIALFQQVTMLPRQTGSGFADVLLEDLFSRQRPDLQRFLLDTAILERLSPSLCDAVTGRNDGQAFLSELERAHFFVQRLDESGEWLRYHHLFRNFLKKRLNVLEPDRAADLGLRAGNWLAANDQIPEALNHWLGAGAYESAANLLAQHGRRLLRNAQFKELEAWLNQLPGTSVSVSAVLSTLRAWTCLYLGRPTHVYTAIEDAQRAVLAAPEATPPTLIKEWVILRALAGVTRFDWVDASAVHPTLPDAFNDEAPLQRAFSHVVVAYAKRNDGRLEEAEAFYRRGAELADVDDVPSVHCIARYCLGALELLRARPDKALETVQSWFSDPLRRPHWRNGSAAFLRATQALALFDQDRLPAALTIINDAVALLESTGTYSFYGMSLVMRARILAVAGRREEALADLALARESAMPGRIARTHFRADLCEAQMLTQEGKLGPAERLLTRARKVLDESGQSAGENLEAWQNVYCEWLLASRRSGEAEIIAAAGEASAQAAGRIRHVIDFLLWRALALQSRPGGIAPAAACLRTA